VGFRLTALPEAMRDFGVDVVEVAGCYGRGAAYPRPPAGGIDHWTVGAATGEAPSLAICTYGRGRPGHPNYLPGPLIPVLRGRRTNGRCRAFFIADGIGNHAGRGRLATTSGRIADTNGELFGLEVEYRPYDEPIRDEDLDIDARIHAAAAQVCGYTAADVAGHWEYATPAGRKVDRKTIAGARLRGLVDTHLHPAPMSEEDDDVTVLAWFQDPDKPDQRHCYAITGRTAAWCPTTKAIDVQVYFGATWWGGKQTVLPPADWNDLSLAIMNGPLANLRAAPAS
jgi:hypothetical protein